MLNDIERSYVKHGYRLPQGFSWTNVREHRRHWNIAATFVQLAVASGCISWGVLYAGGVPLKHP
ncbi:MAG TPA: hypothetical protein VFK19_03535 [Sphingomicrobium sp.]|nr:hypothetical protein [Sphingomicrobium sp.]